MKYVFYTLLFILTLSTCVRAQAIQLEEKPGSPDSLRWRYEITDIDGSVRVITSTYDTITKVIEFGRDLYASGGYIGTARIPQIDEYYTDEVIRFINENNFFFGPERESLSETMGDVALYDPMHSDSTLCYDLIGTWSVAGYHCNAVNDTLVVEMQDYFGKQRMMVVDPTGTEVQPVLYWGEGVAGTRSKFDASFLPLIRVDSTQWRGPLRCYWTRIED